MRRRVRAGLINTTVFGVLFLSATGCAGHAAAPVVAPIAAVADATGLTGVGMVSAGSRPLPAANAAGVLRLSLTVGGLKRGYLLAPARKKAPRMRPALLLYLPSANTLLGDEYVRYGLDLLRDHGMTVVVAGPWAGSWNAGRCCGQAHQRRVDDVAAVSAMRDDALRIAGADPARVVVLGHSAGALMAWRLACDGAFGAAAVVAVAGTLVSSCPALPSVPAFLAVNGGRDTSIPLEGSTRVVPLLGIAPPSVRKSLAVLALAGGCQESSVSSGLSDVHGCRGANPLQLRVLENAGHSWAGLDGTRAASLFLHAHVAGID